MEPGSPRREPAAGSARASAARDAVASRGRAVEESELVAPLEWAAVESRPEEEPVGEAAGLGARAEAA